MRVGLLATSFSSSFNGFIKIGIEISPAIPTSAYTIHDKPAV